MKPKHLFYIASLALCSSLLIVGCGGDTAVSVAADEGTPTIHPYFSWGSASPASVTATPPPADPGATPTVFRYFDHTELPTPRPTNTRRPTPTPRPTETPAPTATLRPTNTPFPGAEGANSDGETALEGDMILFGDSLNPNWTLAESWDVRYDVASTAYVHNGEFALSVTPTQTFGSIFFAVDPNTEQEYFYLDILGVSFWINPGEQELALEDMAISVLGSNDYPYWRSDDNSVEGISGEDGFSETRLYFLDFNRSLPAGEWTEVVIWLDDLVYDPTTTYLTGIYLKSGEAYEGTYTIDDVTLLTEGS